MSVRAFREEMSIWMGGLSPAAGPHQRGWASCNPLRAWIEQIWLRKVEFFLCLSAELGHILLPLELLPLAFRLGPESLPSACQLSGLETTQPSCRCVQLADGGITGLSSLRNHVSHFVWLHIILHIFYLILHSYALYCLMFLFLGRTLTRTHGKWNDFNQWAKEVGKRVNIMCETNTPGHYLHNLKRVKPSVIKQNTQYSEGIW